MIVIVYVSPFGISCWSVPSGRYFVVMSLLGLLCLLNHVSRMEKERDTANNLLLNMFQFSSLASSPALSFETGLDPKRTRLQLLEA
jgi:hypothetical protein